MAESAESLRLRIVVPSIRGDVRIPRDTREERCLFDDMP